MYIKQTLLIDIFTKFTFTLKVCRAPKGTCGYHWRYLIQKNNSNWSRSARGDIKSFRRLMVI